MKNFDHSWRKQLLSYAKGKVLEISVGTGTNFNYYPLAVEVVATDTSIRMIEKAKTKAAENGVKATFMVAPVEELQLEANSFNTIVSTFSLCESGNPLWILNQFNKWCKPNGTILLLEHGLSNNSIIRWLQKKWAPQYYKKTGCHPDTDIKDILEHAAPVIKKVEQKMGGTIYMIWASPNFSKFTSTVKE